MSQTEQNSSGTWILINGQVYVINYKVSIFEILIFLQKNKSGLITEHNQKILSDEASRKTFLNEFDRIEFVTIVGGG